MSVSGVTGAGTFPTPPQRRDAMPEALEAVSIGRCGRHPHVGMELNQLRGCQPAPCIIEEMGGLPYDSGSSRANPLISEISLRPS
jgi:hypothetical protein